MQHFSQHKGRSVDVNTAQRIPGLVDLAPDLQDEPEQLPPQEHWLNPVGKLRDALFYGQDYGGSDAVFEPKI